MPDQGFADTWRMADDEASSQLCYELRSAAINIATN